MTLVIILAIAAALFGLAYLAKRRFGVLGLGLAAGVLLSQNATKFLSGVLETNNIPVAPLTPDVSATVILTLLPALLLLMGGPSYRTKRAASLGAAAFAILGVLLVLGPLTLALSTEDQNIRLALTFIAQWQGVIIAVAIAFAVLDTIMLHTISGGSKKRAKH